MSATPLAQTIQTRCDRLIATGRVAEAERLVQSHPGALPPPARRFVLARIRLAQGNPDAVPELLAPLMDKPAFADRALRLVARAHLLAGRNVACLDCLDRLKKPDSASEAMVVAALIEQGRLRRVRKRVRQALAGETAIVLAKQVIARLVRAGEIDLARSLLERAEPGPDGRVIGRDFLCACLRTGRGELARDSWPKLRKLGVSLSRTAASALEARLPWDGNRLPAPGPETEAIRKAVATAVGACDDVETVFNVMRILFRSGDDAHARQALEHFRGLVAGLDDPADPFRGRRPGPGAGWATEGDPRLQALAGWIGVPGAERGAWLRDLRRALVQRRIEALTLYTDPGFFSRRAAEIRPADWSAVQKLAGQKKPVILASTHAGYLMGIVMQCADHGIPVKILGGNMAAWHLLPGGRVFDPILTFEDEARVAKRLLRRLQQGGIVAMTADGQRGRAIYEVEHDGYLFDLPGSVPQLAHRMGVAVFWVCTYWKDGALTCEVARMPEPRPEEAADSFRNRWFRAYLDHVRAVMRADPRNVARVGRIRPAL